MATYVPNATQITEPLESQTVESAALEFRTLKSKVTLDKITIDADLQAIGSSLEAEITTRSAVDVSVSNKLDELDYAISAINSNAAKYADVWYFSIGTTPGTSNNQTLFIGLDLDADNVEVFYNGVLLAPGVDYTYTPTSVLLTTPVQLTDSITIYTYRQVITSIDGGVY